MFYNKNGLDNKYKRTNGLIYRANYTIVYTEK